MFYELTGKKHSYVDALLITISDISNADVALMPWHSILTLQVSQEPVTYKACADEFADMLAKEGLWGLLRFGVNRGGKNCDGPDLLSIVCSEDM